LSELLPITIIEYPGDGTTDRAIPFTYDDPSEVQVFVDGVPTAFTIPSPSNVRIEPAPPSGTTIRIRKNSARKYPKAWQSSAMVKGGDLNIALQHAVDLGIEAKDRADVSLAASDTAVDDVNAALAELADDIASIEQAKADAENAAAASEASADEAEVSASGALDSALRAEAAASAAAGGVHTHPISQITGLESALLAKASAEHEHGMDEITGLLEALDEKLSLGVATAADYRAKAVGKALTPEAAWDGALPVDVSEDATIALNFAVGFNFVVAPLTANRTLGFPTNVKRGQSGVIEIQQDGTGSRTLAYATGWRFADNVPPIVSTAAGTRTCLSYYVAREDEIWLFAVGNIRWW
jgi:hypothetical protein